MAHSKRPAVRFRNRIIGHGMESPEELAANPRNWRIHSGEQEAAVEGALDGVGWVKSVLVNRRTGYVIDGHLRVAIALKHHEPVIPVDYVDLTEEEERVVLATLDPLSELATVDKDKLRDLLEEIGARDGALGQLLEDLAAEVAPLATDDEPFDPAALPDAPPGAETSESYLVYVAFPTVEAFRAGVARLAGPERAARVPEHARICALNGSDVMAHLGG